MFQRLPSYIILGVLLMSMDQRWLDRSHKSAEEGESTRARPVLTAYSHCKMLLYIHAVILGLLIGIIDIT